MPNPTPIPVQRHPLAGTGRYGAASVRDFDNPNKWTTVSSVPVLDEHELTDDDGKVVGYVDQRMLSEIAANNNKRVIETNDPAPLIVGHTSDDPQAPERPVAGYAVNYKVKPFKRDPKTGRTIYAIHADYKVRKDREQVIEDFPRRSVELWLGRKELDPIALLGGTTPERDLGVIIRKSRISGFTLDRTPARNSRRDLERNTGPVLYYSKQRGQLLRYAAPQLGYIEDGDVEQEDESINYSCGDNGMTPMKGKSSKPPGMKVAKKKLYEAGAEDGMESEDDLPPENDLGGGPGPDVDDGGDPAGDDPAVAAIFQSKQFIKMLQTAVQSAIEGLLEAEEGGAGPGGPPAGPGAGPGGPPPMDDGMGGEPPMGPEGTDGLAPQPEEEARIDHEAPPVRFGANSGYAGPQSTMVPTPQGTKGARYARTNHQPQPQGNRPMTRTAPQQTRQDPEVVRLSRRLAEQDKTIKDLLLRNARVESEKIISDFMTNSERDPEGPVVFNDPEAEVELLANMDAQSREYHIDNIRRNYRRAGSTQGHGDPTSNGSVNNLMRYGRSQVQQPETGGEGDEENYTPQSPSEAVAIADAQAGKYGKPMTTGEAIKYLRSRGAIRPSRNGTPRQR